MQKFGIPIPFIPIARLFLLLILILTIGCGQEEVSEEKVLIRPVKYLQINQSGQIGQLEFPGKITAAQEVLMAFEVPGKIESFPVKEGLRVAKGQVLGKLDPRDFETAVRSATADLNAARADYERARELYENNTISKRDLDVARRNFEVAKAAVSAAQKTLDDTLLRAPFSGLVAKTLVENFQNIQAKQTVLILQDDSSLELVVDIPENDYARVDKNASMDQLTKDFNPMIEISSFPGEQFKARVKETAGTADPVTRTFEITLGFSPPKNFSILPGMTARLIVSPSATGGGNTIMIPAKAVFSDEQKNPSVWLINTDTNQVKRQPIVVGEMSGNSILVKSGLKQGDIIAASGVQQLRENMGVRKYEN